MEPASSSANSCARFPIGISGLGCLAPAEGLLSPIIRSFVLMADVSVLETKKTSHVRGAECVFPLDTKMRWRARSAAPFFVYQLKSLPLQAVALEMRLAIVEGA